VNQRSAIEQVQSEDDIFAQVNSVLDLNKISSLSDLNFLFNNHQKSQSSLHQNAHALSSRSISLLTDPYSSGLKMMTTAMRLRYTPRERVVILPPLQRLGSNYSLIPQRLPIQAKAR
jgi:hypothetical protein